ncbi:hypothetical protein [Kistimonas scapharcae]
MSRIEYAPGIRLAPGMTAEEFEQRFGNLDGVKAILFRCEMQNLRASMNKAATASPDQLRKKEFDLAADVRGPRNNLD